MKNHAGTYLLSWVVCGVSILAAAQPPESDGAAMLSNLEGAWIGGIDWLRNDGSETELVLNYLSFQFADGEVVGTMEFLDRPGRLVEQVDGVLPVSGGVSFSAVGGTFELALDGNELVGKYVRTGNEGPIERAARWTRIADVEVAELEKHAAHYELPTGKQFRIDAVQPGFLRMFDPASGRFQNLYPRSADEFFHGPDFERPNPVHGTIAFSDDHLEIRRHREGALRSSEIARKVSAPDLPVRWKANGDVARLDLPGGVGMTFLRVRAGKFEMGQRKTADRLAAALGAEEMLENDPELRARLKPLVQPVTLSKDFWLGQFEVTNRQFAAFVSATGYMTDAERMGWGMRWTDSGFESTLGRSWRSPGYPMDPEHPATMLTWFDAVAFTDWLSEVTGESFRLPTEAEWEYAARAGSDALFDFGDEVDRLEEHAHFGKGEAEQGRSPIRVGSKLPNRWGFYDMQGNVWEWTLDRGGELSTKPVTDPHGPPDGEGRMLRGGSWINGPFSLRLAYRAQDDPNLKEPHFGFRLAVGS